MKLTKKFGGRTLRCVGMLPLLSAFLSASLASESFPQAACAADGPPPTFALLLVGNFRTFYDPRVYKSIRTTGTGMGITRGRTAVCRKTSWTKRSMTECMRYCTAELRAWW